MNNGVLTKTRISFDEFKRHHGRNYANLEENNFRMEIYNRKVQIIEEHNQNVNNAYKMAINQFSDYLDHEVIEKFTGYKKSNNNDAQFLRYSFSSYPLPPPPPPVFVSPESLPTSFGTYLS